MDNRIQAGADPNSGEQSPKQARAKVKGAASAHYFSLALPALTLLLVAAVAIQILFSQSAQDMPGQTGNGIFIAALLIFAAITSVYLVTTLLKVPDTAERVVVPLPAEKSLMDDFFETNPEIMFIKNLDGSFHFANEMCRRLADMPEADLRGRDRFDVFPEDASSAMQEQDMQVLLNEEAMEFHTRWKRDGTTRHFKTLRFPMRNPEGDIVAIGGVASDVTDQVNSRHALLDQEQLLKTFIESAPDAVLICDTDGQIILTNKQTSSVFSYERDEFLEYSIFDLIPELDVKLITDLFEDAKILDGEFFRVALEESGVDKNNRNFPIEFSLAPITTKEGSLIICLLRDVSERALMETQIRQSQKMDAIGKLTGGMAHDFNNLLGIIIGNLDLTLSKINSDDDPFKKRLTTALHAAERGADLTKRMLAVARRQPLQPKSIDVNGIVEEMAEMLPATLGPDIEMSFEFMEDLPPILVDASGLEGMLLNLAINSRDAMPAGGQFSIVTNVKTRDDIVELMPNVIIKNAKFVHILVSDNGTGMSQDTLNRAFEPFFSTKDKTKGTGLGLAMIYGFVKQSRGFIILNSELGAGTSIDIFLPVDEQVNVQLQQKTKKERVASVANESTLVLVVDDEPDLLEVAVAYLQDLGCQVLSASGGNEGLGVLAENPEVDILLTDIVMPGGMNGVAFANEVRSKHPDIKVIYTSGFPSGVIEETANANLDAPLVSKPYNREDLGNMVNQVLEQPDSPS
ncbi:MAG: PAS domain-containing protein [Proteobacteria bacterium]|nr:PAS domain-containing protein [Pseudomonadota bacterium]